MFWPFVAAPAVLASACTLTTEIAIAKIAAIATVVTLAGKLVLRYFDISPTVCARKLFALKN